jgi:GTP cyclohydrolase I
MDRAAAARAIDAFLRAIDRDPAREPELAATGERVAQAYADELCAGYRVDVKKLLAENVMAGDGDLVVVRNVAVTTTCPHHLMPAHGRAHVAFAPKGRILGLGAIVQLVHAYAWRLTLQEELGQNVVGALMDALAPRWAACRLVMEHGCVQARGERVHGAMADTLALAGAADAETRSEAHRALGVGT